MSKCNRNNRWDTSQNRMREKLESEEDLDAGTFDYSFRIGNRNRRFNPYGSDGFSSRAKKRFDYNSSYREHVYNERNDKNSLSDSGHSHNYWHENHSNDSSYKTLASTNSSCSQISNEGNWSKRHGAESFVDRGKFNRNDSGNFSLYNEAKPYLNAVEYKGSKLLNNSVGEGNFSFYDKAKPYSSTSKYKDSKPANSVRRHHTSYGRSQIFNDVSSEYEGNHNIVTSDNFESIQTNYSTKWSTPQHSNRTNLNQFRSYDRKIPNQRRGDEPDHILSGETQNFNHVAFESNESKSNTLNFKGRKTKVSGILNSVENPDSRAADNTDNCDHTKEIPIKNKKKVFKYNVKIKKPPVGNKNKKKVLKGNVKMSKPPVDHHNTETVSKDKVKINKSQVNDKNKQTMLKGKVECIKPLTSHMDKKNVLNNKIKDNNPIINDQNNEINADFATKETFGRNTPRSVDVNPSDEFDLKEFFCVHCNFTSGTVSLYEEHLNGLRHSSAFKLVKRNILKKFSYLKTVLRRQRDIYDTDPLYCKNSPTFCSVCKSYSRQPFEEHVYSEIHKSMLDFSKPYCTSCTLIANSRLEYENHICSVDHLVKVNRVNCLEKIKKSEFIKEKTFNYCEICHNLFLERDLEKHCASSQHTRVVDFLKKNPHARKAIVKETFGYCQICCLHFSCGGENKIFDHCTSSDHTMKLFLKEENDLREKQLLENIENSNSYCISDTKNLKPEIDTDSESNYSHPGGCSLFGSYKLENDCNAINGGEQQLNENSDKLKTNYYVEGIIKSEELESPVESNSNFSVSQMGESNITQLAPEEVKESGSSPVADEREAFLDAGADKSNTDKSVGIKNEELESPVESNSNFSVSQMGESNITQLAAEEVKESGSSPVADEREAFLDAGADKSNTDKSIGIKNEELESPVESNSNFSVSQMGESNITQLAAEEVKESGSSPVADEREAFLDAGADKSNTDKSVGIKNEELESPVESNSNFSVSQMGESNITQLAAEEVKESGSSPVADEREAFLDAGADKSNTDKSDGIKNEELESPVESNSNFSVSQMGESNITQLAAEGAKEPGTDSSSETEEPDEAFLEELHSIDNMIEKFQKHVQELVILRLTQYMAYLKNK